MINKKIKWQNGFKGHCCKSDLVDLPPLFAYRKHDNSSDRQGTSASQLIQLQWPGRSCCSGYASSILTLTHMFALFNKHSKIYACQYSDERMSIGIALFMVRVN